MKYDYLIFDLDGTISDPKEGITKSINHALAHHGFAHENEDKLATYIGPQIDSIFKTLTQSENTDLIQSLVAQYRERYSDIGFSENILYNDIPEILAELSSIPSLTLGVCTSKRVDFAERILDMFNLRHLFQFVNGGDVGIAKWEQLQQLIKENTITQNALMIGDRYIDLDAAHKNKLSSAGVLWGHGSLEEIKQYDPTYIFSQPTELLTLIKE